MEPHAPLFPSFIAPLSDLYGASSYRVGESHAFEQDLDDLDREDLALEQTVRALVDRKAPSPIGLSFHRAKTGAAAAAPPHGSASSHLNRSVNSMNNTPTMSNRLQRGGVAPLGTEGSRLGSGVQTTRGYPGHNDEDEDGDEEDDEEVAEEGDMEEEGDDSEEPDDEDDERDEEELFSEADAGEHSDHDDDHDDEERGDDDSMDVSE